MQYRTFGASISPWISPASFNSLRCCETVALAMGSTSWISPKSNSAARQESAGWPSGQDGPSLWQSGRSVPRVPYSLSLSLVFRCCSQIYEHLVAPANFSGVFCPVQSRHLPLQGAPCGMPKRVRGIYASALQRFRLYAGWGLLLPAHFRFGRADLFRLHVVPIFGPLFSNLDLFSYLCKVIYTQRNEYGQTDRNDRQRD